MDRRTAISRLGIMLGGTLSASTLSALVSGCTAPPEEGFTSRALSKTQLSRLGRIVDVIIPDTDTPGARQAGVHRFIDTLLAEYLPPTEVEPAIDQFESWSKELGIDALSDADLEDALRDLDERWASGGQEDAWGRLKEWTVAGYYTSEIGMTQELRLKPYTEARMDIPRSDVERTWAN